MKYLPQNQEPIDISQRLGSQPVISYPLDTLLPADISCYQKAREDMTLINEVLIPPREAKTFSVPAGYFFRIVSIEGPQVGDLNLWYEGNLRERFYSGKTRALYGTHVSTVDQLWSSFPYFRPMATITHDTLDWYGWDEDGASVHDVIGTRCDPYTHMALNNRNYHYCCHSNLCRALGSHQEKTIDEIEHFIHDVLNVFMCTGFTKDTHQYFMKASPVRPSDFIEFFAEIDLLGELSACPGGDCGSGHSSDVANYFPLKVGVYKPQSDVLVGWSSPGVNTYSVQQCYQ